MKLVKVAIGVVIAISVIPIVVLSINNITNVKYVEKTFTYEYIGNDDATFLGDSSNKFDIFKIFTLDEYRDNINIESYVIDVLYNNNSIDNDIEDIDKLYIEYEYYGSNDTWRYRINVFTIEDGFSFSLISPDTYDTLILTSNGELTFNTGDTITFILNVPEKLPISPTIKIILELIPLIFIAGIIYFAYQRREI